MMTVHFYRRNLPHWQPEAVSIFLTWRLHGSFPNGFAGHLSKWRHQPRRQFLSAERILDAGSSGPLWLADPEIAAIVGNTLKRGAKLGHCILHAYVVMPNHVHALLDPLVPLAKLMSGIKGVSAREANAKLRRSGNAFWQDESFDHWVRDADEFVRTKTYIENNPVKARLCAKPEEWCRSSAHK
jgi:type I restriction enzyme R subunit/putative DNA methylase